MIRSSQKGEALEFGVQVVPRASRSVIRGEHDGKLRVRIAAPPVDGAANEELLRVLAKAFRVRKSAVGIISGDSSKTKQVRIDGVTESALIALLLRESES